MARRNVFLLVGPEIPVADTLHQQLVESPALLTAAGLVPPPVAADDLSRAGIEILRTHKANGLRRKDVEGTWARVCRKAWKTRRDTLVIVPAFADANPEQAALALDSLAGLRVHVLATAGLDAWARHLKPSRFHVLTASTRDELLAQIEGIAALERLRKKRKQARRALDAPRAA